MTPLERRCRWLLRAYPAWYRRDRAWEMLDTLLEASQPGQSWPSLRDARALVTGGLRLRGWTWSLSMLWVVAGIVSTGYTFYLTTKPYTWADYDVGIGIQGWSTDPVAVQTAIVLATVASLALPLPALIAGFIRLRGSRPRRWPRIAAWAGAWIAGFALGRLLAPGPSQRWAGPASIQVIAAPSATHAAQIPSSPQLTTAGLGIAGQVSAVAEHG